MAQCLTWKVLDQQRTRECLDAVDLEELRALIKVIDESLNGELLLSGERSPAQVNVLLDFYGHLVLFAKSSQFSLYKTSSLFGIVHHVHETSVAQRFSRADSYGELRNLIVQHSVHRPPYSTMVFNVRDVQDIDKYLMSTYYRHYKMYMYCFVPREVATLQTVTLNDLTDRPPAQLPPLSAAMREDVWREKMQEAARQTEEKEMEEELLMSEEVSELQKRSATLDDPQFKAGIRKQLETIRDIVSKKSTDRLDLIEEKLAAIEAKVNEVMLTNNRGAQSSRGPGKRK